MWHIGSELDSGTGRGRNRGRGAGDTGVMANKPFADGQIDDEGDHRDEQQHEELQPEVLTPDAPSNLLSPLMKGVCVGLQAGGFVH